MPITQQRDIEKGNNKRHENLSEPFIKDGSRNLHDSEETRKNESIAMVLVSTAVAVCGSLEFGTCFSLFGALSLDTGRFFTGYGIGIFSYVVPVYIAEISPKELRGGLTTINQLMIVTGSSIVFLLGTIVTWRTLALVGVVPPVLLVAGLLFIPESPRWLQNLLPPVTTSSCIFRNNFPSRSHESHPHRRLSPSDFIFPPSPLQ